MNEFLTRMAGLALAFGLLYGCSSTKPDIQKARHNLDRDRYDKALKAVNSEIESNASNPEAYYLKGNILFKLALSKREPSERTSYYKDMREALAKSRKLYLDSVSTDFSGELEKINGLLNNGWSREYQTGITLVKEDTLSNQLSSQLALDHFNNAITLIPDSTQPYRHKARVLYKRGHTRDAIETLTSVLKLNQRPTPSVLEQLAFLYLEAGSTDQAVALYEEALDQDSGNTNLMHGLVNAYMKRGAHRSAAHLLNKLIKQNPENTSYRLSFASQLYRLATSQLDSIHIYSEQKQKFSDANSNPDSPPTRTYLNAISNKWNQADSLYRRAKQQYLSADSLSSDDPEIDYSIAMFYKNMALDIRQVQPLLPSDKSAVSDKRITEDLKTAIRYLEEAVDQVPDHPRYWNRLYRLYNHFGMKEKAEKARKKANL